MTNEAQFFFDVGKDIAERQSAQIRRMAQVIRNYRLLIRDQCGADTAAAVLRMIADAERDLTDDDRERLEW